MIARRHGSIAIVAAILLPAAVLVGALAMSFRSSSARRLISSYFQSYVALEVAESAIAEAGHVVQLGDLLPEDRFGLSNSSDPTAMLLMQMVLHPVDPRPASLPSLDIVPRLPAGLGLRFEYRDIVSTAGQPVHRMLTGIHFPDAPLWWRRIRGLEATRSVAKENAAILLEGADDLVVAIRPVTWRREFYPDLPGASSASLDPSTRRALSGFRNVWVNWGVLQLRASVKTRDLKGVHRQVLTVNRRFTLRSDIPGSRDRLVVSSRNLSSVVSRDPL